MKQSLWTVFSLFRTFVQCEHVYHENILLERLFGGFRLRLKQEELLCQNETWKKEYGEFLKIICIRDNF